MLEEFTYEDTDALVDQYKLVGTESIDKQPIHVYRCAKHANMSPKDCLKVWLGMYWNFADPGTSAYIFLQLIDAPLSEVPLYINENTSIYGSSLGSVSVADIAKWRLQIAK
jgi:hypothetical protein